MTDLVRRYLAKRRVVDEATALRRIRATDADLRVWRRDPNFREEERAAVLAPRRRSRVISLVDMLTPEERGELIRNRMEQLGYQTDPLGIWSRG